MLYKPTLTTTLTLTVRQEVSRDVADIYLCGTNSNNLSVCIGDDLL